MPDLTVAQVNETAKAILTAWIAKATIHNATDDLEGARKRGEWLGAVYNALHKKLSE
jgi:hypothetical protein